MDTSEDTTATVTATTNTQQPETLDVEQEGQHTTTDSTMITEIASNQTNTASESTPETTTTSNMVMETEQQISADSLKELPHPKSTLLNIFSYGFGGVRYDNIIVVSSSEALIPIGASIARWDIKRGRRLDLVQTNSDSIFVLLNATRFYVSISYSGQISIVEPKSLEVLNSFHTSGRIVRHASISDTHLAVSCEKYQLKKGITEVYQLSDIFDNYANKPIYQIKGKHRFATLSNQNILVTLLEKPVKTNLDEQVNPPTKQKSNKAKKVFHEITQHDLTSLRQVNTTSAPYVCDIVSSSSDGYKYAAFLYQDRHLMIIDMTTLSMVSLAKILGTSGSIMSSTFTDVGQLALSPAPNYILYVNCSVPLPREVIGNVASTNEAYSIQKVQSRAAHHENYFSAFLKDTIFSANEAGFVTQSVSNLKDAYTFNGINVTCCGLAINSSETLVAVGDFLGNVYVYPAFKSKDNDAIFQTCVMSSIRSLAWDPSDANIVIGTMEGSIFKWTFEDYSTQPQLIANLKGSITSLRYKTDTQSVKLLASNTEGQFAIFDEAPGSSIKTEILFYGHLPSRSTDQFGSLSKFAEIWSSTWDPNSTKRLATCSEDQTVHVFDLSNKQPLLVHELKGHTLAVTSVDWQEMSPELGEIFISCADDQTLRVYAPNNGFQFVYEFSTAFVREWHTLTYLALEKNGTRVAIGSQNGYFFIYNLLSKKFEYSEKVHMGGIEGVVWRGSKIITCSSDCSINIIEIP